MKKIILIILLLLPFNVFAEKIEVTLNKCIDGDTASFNLNNEIIKARFLAIDTPESTNKIEAYGKEASKYTCDILSNSTSIQIEYDKNSNKYDKYNRHLVWVFVDNELLQREIVKNGYAEVKYLYGDYKYTDELEEEEIIAKQKKLRIWSEYEYDDIAWYYYLLFILAIISLFIFSKKFRKKFFNILKKENKKILKKINL